MNDRGREMYLWSLESVQCRAHFTVNPDLFWKHCVFPVRSIRIFFWNSSIIRVSRWIAVIIQLVFDKKISTFRDVTLLNIPTVFLNSNAVYLRPLCDLLRHITDKNTILLDLVNGTHAVIGPSWIPLYWMKQAASYSDWAPFIFQCLYFILTEVGMHWSDFFSPETDTRALGFGS